MKSTSGFSSNWSGGANTPELSPMHWNILAIPAAVLAVMAILQAISFSSFSDWLNSIGVGGSTVIAVVIIIAELWGAASLLRMPMSFMIRFFGISLAVLVAGFWFIENIKQVTNSAAGSLQNSGYFGKYLSQTPGWWTVIEITILLFLVVFAAEMLRWRRQNR